MASQIELVQNPVSEKWFCRVRFTETDEWTTALYDDKVSATLAMITMLADELSWLEDELLSKMQ